MGNMTLFIAGIAILSLGTYLMRLGGAKLGNRLAFSERSQALLSDAATVLLFSVALATTFYEGAHFAGMARVLGVAFAVFLAWRKVPLIGVIIAAAVVTVHDDGAGRTRLVGDPLHERVPVGEVRVDGAPDHPRRLRDGGFQPNGRT